jgi:hypothetical protein
MLFHLVSQNSESIIGSSPLPPGVVKDIEKAVEETSTMDAPTEEEKALWKGLRD